MNLMGKSSRSGFSISPRKPAHDWSCLLFRFLAIGVMKAAHIANVSIPHDLSVVGADDVPIASFLTPSLSSVHVDLVGMGRKAVSLLT